MTITMASAGKMTRLHHAGLLASPTRTTDKPSLRSQLRQIQRLDAHHPARSPALAQLLTDAQMRTASRDRSKLEGHSPSALKQRCKRALSKCLNKIYFGRYAHTAAIAEDYARENLKHRTRLTGKPPETSDADSVDTTYVTCKDFEDDAETAYFSCYTNLPNDDSTVSTFQSARTTDTASTSNTIHTSSIATLKPLIRGAVMAMPDGADNAKKAALEALDAILFAYDSRALDDADETIQATWCPDSLALTVHAERARIGTVTPSSRVPLNFALSNHFNLRLSSEAQGAVTLHFDGPSFYSVRLTPEAALRLCNSYNFAARAAGAVPRTMEGLERSASSHIQALTFTANDTALLKEAVL